MILSTAKIIFIRALSELIFHEQCFFLKTAAGGKVLELDEQEVWAKFEASMLLCPLNVLTSAFYFPHWCTFLASLFRMGVMLNSIAPAITSTREVGWGQQSQDNMDIKEINPHSIWKQQFLLSSGLMQCSKSIPCAQPLISTDLNARCVWLWVESNVSLIWWFSD